MSSILCSHVMCLSDYEVVHTSSELTSDPVYHHDDYQEDSAKQKEFDLSGFKRISPTPKFTLSHLYISPENAEPHFTRSVSKSNGYNDGYSAFVENNFQENDHDEEVNSKYRENNYDDDEEEVNSKFRQQNSDGDYDDEEVNSRYRHVPEDVEGNEHHSYNGDELDRIKSLPQKNEAESIQNSKNCKVIVKGKAMCTLCTDPVSGAHSESCSFSSAAPEMKYAYIEKEKYIS